MKLADHSRHFVVFSLLASVWTTVSRSAEPEAGFDFAHRVVPILKAHCLECHGGHRHEGDVSINTRESILDAGMAEPGDASESHLMELVTTDDAQITTADFAMQRVIL